MNKIRTCKYRNCDKDISHMRRDALFCCRKHKTYENIYVKRGLEKGNTKV